jgi:Pretoxin HINT domain
LPLLASGKSADPQSFNRYAYVENNPLARVDPDGNDWYKAVEYHVRRDGSSYKTSQPYWSDKKLMKPKWDRGGVYRVATGNRTGQYIALDPNSSTAMAFGSSGEAKAAFEEFRKQRNADVVGGVVHAVADNADSMSQIGVNRVAANLLLTLAGIHPNENSEVYGTANHTATATLIIGTVVLSHSIPVGEGGVGENVSTSTSRCFKAGTLVHTSEGLKPIEQIKPGTKVLSFDQESRIVEYKPVVRTFVHESSNLFEVKIDGQTEPIVVTNGHPFYVHRSRSNLSADEGEWINSDALEAGDFVRRPDGSWVQVLLINPVEGSATVYTFEVE